MWVYVSMSVYFTMVAISAYVCTPLLIIYIGNNKYHNDKYEQVCHMADPTVPFLFMWSAYLFPARFCTPDLLGIFNWWAR